MKHILVVFIFCCFFSSYSQTSDVATSYLQVKTNVDYVAYTRDYVFIEGIYLTISDFTHNNPIQKTSIVSTIPQNQIDFMSQVMEQKYVFFKNNQGIDRKVKSDSVWGFSQNNALYLNFNHEFNRISVIGSVFHFLATVTTSPVFRDPMDANYAMNTYDEQRQFVLDTESNKVMDFNVKNMEVILIRDTFMYAEFMKLSKRKKSDSIFIYLRKYNLKHPLYLFVK